MRRASDRLRRPAMALAALLLGGFALAALARPGIEHGAASTTRPLAGSQVAAGNGRLLEQGRGLFVEGCSSCHGFDARGVSGSGPSLIGAGAQSADFYLRTGRMPLDEVGDQPLRADPHYPEPQIRALV